MESFRFARFSLSPGLRIGRTAGVESSEPTSCFQIGHLRRSWHAEILSGTDRKTRSPRLVSAFAMTACCRRLSEIGTKRHRQGEDGCRGKLAAFRLRIGFIANRGSE